MQKALSSSEMLRKIFFIILMISKTLNSVVPRSAKKEDDFDDLTIEMKISRRKEFMDFDDIDYESREMESAETLQTYPVQMMNDIRKFEYYPDADQQQVGVKMVPVYYRVPQQEQQINPSAFFARQLQALSNIPFYQPPAVAMPQMRSMMDVLTSLPSNPMAQATSLMPMMQMTTQSPMMTPEQAMMMMHMSPMMNAMMPQPMKAEPKSQPPVIVHYCPPKSYAPSYTNSYQQKSPYTQHIAIQPQPATPKFISYASPSTSAFESPEKSDNSWISWISKLPLASSNVLSFTNPWFTLFDKLAKVKNALPNLPTFNVIGK